MIIFKNYMNGENVDERHYLDDSIAWNDFYNNVKYIKPVKGLISLKNFFDKDNVGDFDGEAEELVNNKEAFMAKYGNWIINDEDEDVVQDNTYNYEGNIESAVNITLVHIVDPDSREYDAKTIAIMSVCLASDIRGAYSDNCIAVFDSSTDITDWTYKAMTFLGRKFNVINGTAIIDNKKYDFSFDTSAMQDTYTISLINQDDDADSYEDDDCTMEFVDNDDIIEAIKELDDTDSVKLENVDFTEYAID